MWLPRQGKEMPFCGIREYQHPKLLPGRQGLVKGAPGLQQGPPLEDNSKKRIKWGWDGALGAGGAELLGLCQLVEGARMGWLELVWLRGREGLVVAVRRGTMGGEGEEQISGVEGLQQSWEKWCLQTTN